MKTFVQIERTTVVSGNPGYQKISVYHVQAEDVKQSGVEYSTTNAERFMVDKCKVDEEVFYDAYTKDEEEDRIDSDYFEMEDYEYEKEGILSGLDAIRALLKIEKTIWN